MRSREFYMKLMYLKKVMDRLDNEGLDHIPLEDKFDYALMEAKCIKLFKSLGNNAEETAEKLYINISEVQLIYAMDDKGWINWSSSCFKRM